MKVENEKTHERHSHNFSACGKASGLLESHAEKMMTCIFFIGWKTKSEVKILHQWKKYTSLESVTQNLVYFFFFFFKSTFFRAFEMTTNTIFISANDNTAPNYFAPLPPPALFHSAYPEGFVYVSVNESDSTINTVYLTADIPPQPTPPTPPLFIREDLYDVYEITRQEYLDSIDGWDPIPINRRLY